MDSPRRQISLTAMLGLVAAVAVNLWLFRVGLFWGVLGLTATKHVVIAHLCHVVGLNRKAEADRTAAEAMPSRRAIPEPSSN
jgi:hypothetical protein